MCIGSYADISVHAPTRGATSNSLSFSIFSVFQSTLPREERLLGLNFKEANSIFQSTLPREERQQLLHHNYYHHQFQSTLPREERRIFDFIRIIFILFQSTLPREERPVPAVLHPSCVRFQSTLPREERRLLHFFQSQLFQFQSTLPREERPTQPIIPMIHNNFNPRSHERSDTFAISTIRLSHISIHAPTRGATQCQNLLQHQR